MAKVSRTVTTAGWLLVGAAALGLVDAVLVFTASASAAAGEFSNELMISAVLAGLVALVLGVVGLLCLRRGKVSGAGAWVLLVFVLCLGFAGLPSTNAKLSTMLADATAVDSQHARATADAIIRAVPHWLVSVTFALAGAMAAAVLAAAVLLSIRRSRPDPVE